MLVNTFLSSSAGSGARGKTHPPAHLATCLHVDRLTDHTGQFINAQRAYRRKAIGLPTGEGGTEFPSQAQRLPQGEHPARKHRRVCGK
jgi:hypothetical protein